MHAMCSGSEIAGGPVVGGGQTWPESTSEARRIDSEAASGANRCRVTPPAVNILSYLEHLLLRGRPLPTLLKTPKSRSSPTTATSSLPLRDHVVYSSNASAGNMQESADSSIRVAI